MEKRLKVVLRQGLEGSYVYYVDGKKTDIGVLGRRIICCDDGRAVTMEEIVANKIDLADGFFIERVEKIIRGVEKTRGLKYHMEYYHILERKVEQNGGEH